MMTEEQTKALSDCFSFLDEIHEYDTRVDRLRAGTNLLKNAQRADVPNVLVEKLLRIFADKIAEV